MKNFRRFTDFALEDIPDRAKLVLVMGPAGSGKSSLFDAFLQWYRVSTNFGVFGDETYFRKHEMKQFDWGNSAQVDLHGNVEPFRGMVHIRTAYRNEPDFSVTSLTAHSHPAERIRVNRLIEDDRSVAENYQRLIYETISGVYSEANNQKLVPALREELIGEVRDSMRRVFGDLDLNSITDPLGKRTFFFKKGEVESYSYKNLSGGEKAAFDLLLDFHLIRRYLPRAIYCVDEVEAHLHTKVQGALLRELVSIVPDESQLWVTTHSLGVLRAAQELDQAAPGSVAVIDFEGVDPDVPQVLRPVTLGRVTWEKFLSIALDDLAERVAPKVLVICEGSPAGKRRKDFDAEIYNRLFGTEAPEVLFISGGSSDEVTRNTELVHGILERVLRGTRVVGLIDRDDRSSTEIEQLERQGTLVLRERSLESYLFADEVIKKLVERECSRRGQNEEDVLPRALSIKNAAIDESVKRGKPRDDLKSAAGDIYTRLKQELQLERCGNSADAFMRDTLAPLLQPGMETYAKLKADVLERALGRSSFSVS